MISSGVADYIYYGLGILLAACTIIGALTAGLQHFRPRAKPLEKIGLGVTVVTAAATALLLWISMVRDDYADKRMVENENKVTSATKAAEQAREHTAIIQVENSKLLLQLEEETSSKIEARKINCTSSLVINSEKRISERAKAIQWTTGSRAGYSKCRVG
jgi:hypothetical protein